MICLACSNQIGSTELLVCINCKGKYHHNCVNMTSAHYRANLASLKQVWQCPSCNNVTSRKKKIECTVEAKVCTTQPQPLLPEQPREEGTCHEQSALYLEDMSCDDSLMELPNESCATGRRTETPQQDDRDHSQISYKDFAALLDLKLTELKTDLNKNMCTKIDSLKTEFNSCVSSLTAEINELKRNVFSVTQRVSVLEAENTALKSSLAECEAQPGLASGTQIIHDTISRLETELNDRDQAALCNDLEITGIPEFKEESTVHIVMGLATKVGVTLDISDIVSVDRVGPPREATEQRQQDGQPSLSRPRPRPLVVRLTRRATRDALLKSARVRRGATTEGIGLPDHTPTKFHFHDRLTKRNRLLFNRTREEGRINQWRFIWTKEGRIYARKTEFSKVCRIRTENDLERIFRVVSSTPNI